MHKSKLSPYSDLIAKIKYKFYLLFYFLIFLNKELHDNFQVPLSIFFFYQQMPKYVFYRLLKQSGMSPYSTELITISFNKT